MKLIRTLFLACLVCLVLLTGVLFSSIAVVGAQLRTGPVVVQTTPAPPQPPAVRSAPRSMEERFQGFEERRYLGPVFRIGVPYVLNTGTEISEAVVIFGDATINGRVDGNVVVVMGNLQVGSTAIVEGAVVNIGGTATVAEGAVMQDDLVIVAGRLEAPPGFSPLGEHVLIGPPGLADGVRGLVPWLTHGLLWGRVIVPSLGWMWPLIGVSFLVFLAVAAAFPRAVHACTATLATRPLSAFFTGILTLLLAGPLSTVLAISVVGIVVIPFVLCALVIGWVVGKVGVAEWIGSGLVPGGDPESRARAIRSMVIGFGLITVAYMIPALGLAAWALVGVFGLGTATLAFFSAVKRERPAPKPKPTPPVIPPPAPSAGPPTHDLPLYGGDPSPATAASSPMAATDVAASAHLGSTAAGFGGGPSMPPPVPGSPGDLASYPRATFLDRFAAFVIDMLLLVIVVNFFNGRHDDDLWFPLVLVYYMTFIAWKGTTMGGIVCSLRVVRTDGTPLRPVDAIVRTLASLFSIAALGIGFLWILLDSNRERQAWHDKIAGTLVVRVPRDLPL